MLVKGAPALIQQYPNRDPNKVAAKKKKKKYIAWEMGLRPQWL